VAGQQFTLGDIAILPYLDAFRGPRPDLMESHKRVKEWYQRVMARPATKATYEPSDEAPSFARRPAA
jgi:glutathione S-transferase